MGGVHASMVASLFPGPVACVPLLAPRSAAAAFCRGALWEATAWKPLAAPVDEKEKVRVTFNPDCDPLDFSHRKASGVMFCRSAILLRIFHFPFTQAAIDMSVHGYVHIFSLLRMYLFVLNVLNNKPIDCCGQRRAVKRCLAYRMSLKH
jgi:Alpha/beta hydrolase domain containing 18